MPIIESFVKDAIRETKDFPVPGQEYKDIGPLLQDPQLSRAVTEALANETKRLRIDAVVGIERGGLMFGPILAQRLDLPFIPICTQGRLPGDTHAMAYNTHTGKITLELQIGSILQGQRVLMHGDTLGEGHDMEAACKLVEKQGASVSGFSFVARLTELQGFKLLKKYSRNIFSLVKF